MGDRLRRGAGGDALHAQLGAVLRRRAAASSWLVPGLARRARRTRRDAARSTARSPSAARSLLYLPWVPTTLYQAAAHRRAVVGGARPSSPCSARPARMLGPVRAGRAAARGRRRAGGAARAATAAAGAARRARLLPARDRRADRRARVAVVAALAGVGDRYLAVGVAPLLLAVAAGLAHAGRLGHRRRSIVAAALAAGDTAPGRQEQRARGRRGDRAEPARPATSSSPPSPSRSPVLALLPAARACASRRSRARVERHRRHRLARRHRAARRDDAPSATSSRCSTSCGPASGSSLVTPIFFDIGRWQAPWTELVRAALGRVAPVHLNDPRFAVAPSSRRCRSSAARTRAGDGARQDRRASPGSRCGPAPRARRRQREHEARAGRLAVRELEVPPMRSASSRPIARPRPKPLSGPAARPRWKRSKMCSRSSGGMPGPRSATVSVRAARRRQLVLTRHRLAAAARSGARCRAGSAPRARRRRGRRGPSSPRAAARVELDVALARAQVELGRHRARQLAELDRLRAQLAPAASSRLRSSSSPARAESRRSSRRALVDLELGVLDVHAPVAQVLLEQLHRALEHRQRRAQLVRGGGDERAPRGLLAAQLLLHARERAGEVADLVAAGVAAAPGASGPSARDPQRAARRRAEPAQQRARERDAEHDATSRPTPAAASSALRTWSTAVSPRSAGAGRRARRPAPFGRRAARAIRTSSPSTGRPSPRARWSAASATASGRSIGGAISVS